MPPASSGASPDTALGVFTEQGPWVVDPDALTWRPGWPGSGPASTPSSPA